MWKAENKTPFVFRLNATQISRAKVATCEGRVGGGPTGFLEFAHGRCEVHRMALLTRFFSSLVVL